MPRAYKGKAKGRDKTKDMLRDVDFMEEDEEEKQEAPYYQEEQEAPYYQEEQEAPYYQEAPSYEDVRVKLQGNPELKEVRVKVRGLQGDTKSPEQVHNLRQRRARPLLSDVVEEALRKNATQKNSKKAIQKKNNNTRKKNSESEQSKYLRELYEYRERKLNDMDMNEQDKYRLNKAIEYLEQEGEEERDYDKYLEEQIDYLREKENKENKKFFILKIFHHFISHEPIEDKLKEELKKELEKEITLHLESLNDWIRNTLLGSLEEMEHYYMDNCISKQASIVQKLKALGPNGIIMAEKYKHLTTPFYYDMQSMSKVDLGNLDDEEKSIWEKFEAYFENKNEKKKRNKEAIYHIFTDDIDMTLHINTGPWRQLFSDGHAFMDTKTQPKTIETCGNRNTPMLPRDNDKNYLCPACTEKIGSEDEKGTFAKEPGVRVSVDHVDPVKHAFITYKNDGLCEQLTMTCYECNLIKSNMPVQKFISMIHEDPRPVYMFRKADLDKEKYLKRDNLNIRNGYYVNNIVRSILKGGIKTLPEMLKSAAQITRTYKNVTELKNKEIQKMLEISRLLVSVPALLELGEASISPEYLLGMVETFIFTIMDIDRLSNGISFDQLTYDDIENILNSFIEKFTEIGNITDDSIRWSNLLDYVTHYARLITRNKYDYFLYKNIMVLFVFQYLDINRDQPIPIDMFKQLCHHIYKTYSDYELYEFWEQQARRSIKADPGHSYVGRHRFMHASASSDAHRAVLQLRALRQHPVVEEAEEEEAEEEKKMSEKKKRKATKSLW
jgi:hypothetical protein